MDVKVSIAAIKDAITKSAAERTSPEVISAAYAVVHLIGGVLLASARLLGAAGPFGMAAVAASGAGLNGVAALIGAAIGYIISCGLAGSIRYLAAIVLVYTISFAFQDTKLASKSVFAPATAAVSALSTGILSSFTSVFTQAPAAAVVLIETVFSFGGCWFFREAMSSRERTTESEELRYAGSVLITAAVLLMAVSQIEIFGAISLGRLAAVLVVMTCTLRCGIMTGCTIGTAFGIAMDLTAGGMPFYTMAYAFAGLLSGMFNRHGRLLFLLSFIIANAAAVACAWAFRQEMGALFEVFAASVIFLLLPSGFLSRAGSMVQPVIGGSGESGLRRYVARKVMSLSDAYGSLYDIVRRNVEEQYNDADPAKVFDRAADSVCLKCKEKNRCWNRDYIDTLSALNDATPKMLDRGTLEIGDIPRRFTEKCKTPEAFVTAVNAELRAAAYRASLPKLCARAAIPRGGSIRIWRRFSVRYQRSLQGQTAQTTLPSDGSSAICCRWILMLTRRYTAMRAEGCAPLLKAERSRALQSRKIISNACRGCSEFACAGSKAKTTARQSSYSWKPSRLPYR